MKHIKYLFVAFLVVFASTSCDDTLDINTNPLAATSADPNAVLPYVFVQYSSRHTTELGTRIMDVPQHFSFCFNSARTGSTSSFLTGNTWFMYYNQVLGNLLLVENDAIEAGEPANNINAIAKIFKAKAYFELSCIWERVPFREALNGADFPSPNFDDQQVIFDGCLGILDEAIGLIDAIPAEGVVDVSVGDLIYEGNMDNWRRWANSLKLRILMMYRNADSGFADAEITKVLSQPLIEDISQAAYIRYAGDAGQQNAFHTIVTAFFGPDNESSSVHAPGPPLFNLVEGTPFKDLWIFDPDDLGPPAIGSRVGFALISNNAIRPDLPHQMFLPAEINFYKAELALDGVSAAGDAQTEFEAGVNNLLSWWGGEIPGAGVTLDQATIDDYIASLGTADVQMVQEHLFLESFMRPIVAWNTVRRTGVPTMDPVPNTSISTILKRFNYAPDEVASNPNTPANPATDVPMWFEN